ncbi:MAG: Dabb family protein [Anaerolineae bacterium]|nr:Dabb family protein [Anaerolineae bacterium]
MFQRIVCFKFKDHCTDPEIAAHMRDFAELQVRISQIASYHGGRVTDQAAPYDSLHYLTFRTVDDVDVYFHHDAHQAFIRSHRDQWADVLVLNGPIED